MRTRCASALCALVQVRCGSSCWCWRSSWWGLGSGLASPTSRGNASCGPGINDAATCPQRLRVHEAHVDLAERLSAPRGDPLIYLVLDGADQCAARSSHCAGNHEVLDGVF